ncbi:MAG: hypothetical protein V3S19_00980 [Gemmatimonadales bacterium]
MTRNPRLSPAMWTALFGLACGAARTGAAATTGAEVLAGTRRCHPVLRKPPGVDHRNPVDEDANLAPDGAGHRMDDEGRLTRDSPIIRHGNFRPMSAAHTINRHLIPGT